MTGWIQLTLWADDIAGSPPSSSWSGSDAPVGIGGAYPRDAVWVQTARITSLNASPLLAATDIYFGSGKRNRITVRETPHQVMALIREAS